MSQFDVFNGDADGICALHQLRLAAPRESTLVSGVKRDIQLLGRVAAQSGDSVTVLDISLDRNRESLLNLLQQGVQVEYFDHHFSGPIPKHPALRAHIDAAPDVCTSVLVDRHLRGRYRLWAVVAAFGDNLGSTARALARVCDLTEDQAARLCDLGEAINYNAYGDTEADLLMPPGRPVPRRASVRGSFRVPCKRSDGRHARRAQAQRHGHGAGPAGCVELPAGSVYVLPDIAWARRVQGALANELAARFPQRAHAVLCQRPDGGYVASVRAPVARPRGADRMCLQFPGGAAAPGAAGIDELPTDRLAEFAAAFGEAFAEEAETHIKHGS